MNSSPVRLLFCVLALLCVAPVFAAPVSYEGQLKTSRENPVTDILILEEDAGGVVHGTVYPNDLPGKGHVAISHNPPFQPVRTMVIGLTLGQDADGADKTQLVMFLDREFVAANRGVPYSEVFPGARHSLSIVSLEAAIAGDVTELAWFTDTFFSGPAAGAAFDSAGPFTVAEFTETKPIGGSETRATFEVSKDFTDDNPGEVEVSISCNTGLILDQSKIISEDTGVTFVITDFDTGELNCEITEDDVAGYNAVYFDGTSNSSTSCEYSDVVVDSEFICEITNTPAPVEVEITKEWVFEGSSDPQDIDQSYELTLYCDAEIVDGYSYGNTLEGPAVVIIINPGCNFSTLSAESGQTLPFHDWCKSFDGDGSDTFLAEVIPEYPTSNCYVTETVYDSAAEVDNGCTNLTVSAGQGTSCTITNTVFFEGIPTLSQYGMGLLALLMLGVGFISFRRFV